MRPPNFGPKQPLLPTLVSGGTLRSEPREIPRTIESGGLHVLSSASVIRAVPQEASDLYEPPKILEFAGFLYRRVDLSLGGEVTTSSNAYQGRPSSADTPLVPQHQDRLSHLSQVPRYADADQSNAQDVALLVDQDESLFVDQDEASFVDQDESLFVDQDVASSVGQDESLFASLDEAPEVQENSQVARNSQPSSHDSTPTHLQSTDLCSAKPAARKHNRKPHMLRELESYNESPEPDSESEAVTPQVTTLASSQPAPSKPTHKSLMLREIEAHNQSPEPESDRQKEALYGLTDDWGDVHLTRKARKDLVSLITGKPPESRDSLNIGRLMLAEFSGIKKGIKTFHAEDQVNIGLSSDRHQILSEEVDEEEEFVTPINTKGRIHPRQTSTRRKMPQEVESSLENIQRNQMLATKIASTAWVTWDSQKERINQLVKSPRYNPNPSQQEMDAHRRKKPAYHATAEIPEAFQDAFYMDNGLYVFTPTAENFADFARFLKDVEEMAGRKMGVVKVIVPSECLSQNEIPSGVTKPRKLPPINTLNVKLSLNQKAAEESDEEAAEESKLYRILPTDGLASWKAGKWLRTIQRDKDDLIENSGISSGAISRNDVWKECHALEPYTESKLFSRSQTQEPGMLCAWNESATPRLRAALRCNGPNIQIFPGNRFASSALTQPGIGAPVFHLASGVGPMSPLQINKYASYSINFHHSGASRIITVVLPEHHAKVEELVYKAQNSETLNGRPEKPPACSQFVVHEPVYMPHATMSYNDIDFTEVVQHQGEMVITFPYAYHQTYVSGPNITEEMLYASDRCKVFHREDLYKRCNSDCGAEQHDPLDLNQIFSNTLSGTRSGNRNGPVLESPLASLLRRQAQETNASQNHDISDRPSSKRVSGLKKMDRVSDDGDWIDPSVQAAILQSGIARKATRLTSNPYEPDMWDPDSAFEPTHGPAAGNIEGSSIGGLRPLDPIMGRHVVPRGRRRTSKRNRDDDTDSDEDIIKEPSHKHSRRRHH